MKRLLYLAILYFLPESYSSQVCTGNFNFLSQADVDAFIVNNPNCTSIVGHVYINPFDSDPPTDDPVTNVDALHNITSISGALKIGSLHGQTVSLGGLLNLTSVEVLHLFSDYDNPLPFSAQPALLSLEQAGDLRFWSVNNFDFTVFDNVTELFFFEVVNSENSNYVDIFPELDSINGIWVQGESSGIGDFTGFENLVYAQSITIYGTFGIFPMGNFNAFHQLQEANYIALRDMNALSFDGFENLVTLEELHLEVFSPNDFPDFPSLESLSEFELQGGGGSQEPISAPALPLITNLYLLSIEGNFDNYGCEQLQTIERDLTINGEGFLSETPFEVFGLDALVWIGEDLSIRNLPASHLDFLSGIEEVWGDITIIDNVFLSDCYAEVLCYKLKLDPYSVSIYNNTGECAAFDVASWCDFGSSAHGVAFADLDCNNIFNGDDVLLDDVLVYNQDGQPVELTHDEGTFYIWLPSPSMTTLLVNSPEGFTYTPLVFDVVDDVVIDYEANIPFCPSGSFHNVDASVFFDLLRPGATAGIRASVYNEGYVVEDVQMTAYITAPFEISILDADGGIVNGNTITWLLNDLDYFSYTERNLQLFIPEDAQMGETVTVNVNVEIIPAVEETNVADNNASFGRPVVSSYDPNDKAVNRSAIEYTEVENGESVTLEYLIRFQNTGTAEAIVVRVEDIISEDLDITSFQMIRASHEYQVVFSDDRKMEWIFQNIYLPDSSSNELLSHGYIHFRINTRNNLQLSDTLSNNVAIFFDFNDPVMTNTATTIFYTCPGNEIFNGDEENVCGGELLALYTLDEWENYEWQVNDQAAGTEHVLLFEEMNPGNYLIELNASTEYCSLSDSWYLEVLELPETPVITQDGNQLSIQPGLVGDWIFNDQLIILNVNSIDITSSGIYTVVVHSEHCSSTASQQFQYTGVHEVAGDISLSIFPNPVQVDLNLRMRKTISKDAYFTITNPAGQTVVQQRITAQQMSIECANMSSGVYFITLIENDVAVNRQKFIVE